MAPPLIKRNALRAMARKVSEVGPAVKGASVTADQINDLLKKGDDAKKAPHKKAISGLSPGDAEAVADYVKTLK